MASPILIDLSNYDSLLVQSSVSRSGSPDGNVFFNKSSGLIEFITVQELATVDLHGGITTGAIEIDVTGNNSFDRQDAGDFVADGFVAGRSIATSSFTAGANNDTFVILSVSASSIVVVGTPLTNETSSGLDEVIASVAEANPLDEVLGIKLEGVYAFENQERSSDEDLRKYDRWTEGNFKFAGAYIFVNSKKPSTTADRDIVRSSGWQEIATDGGVDRIYFGNKGLSNIESASQPYYQLDSNAIPTLNGIAPVDYAKVGQIDESVQVFGDTGNTPTDAGAGNFDTRAFQIVKVRTFGQNYDEKDTVNDLGISELGGYFTGFAVNESIHLTSGAFTIADVYDTQIAPWTGMTLEKLASAQTEGGFNEADGDFTWILHNTGSGNLDELVAFLDALGQTDDDIDTGAVTTTFGRRVGVWYSYDAQGRILTKSGADTLGLFIESVPTADEQDIVFTDDAGATKTRPFLVSVEATLGALAKADANAWFHSFFAALYDQSGALTVEDSSAAEVKGLASSADGDNKIIFAFDYDGDAIGGAPGSDKDCVFLCEGDGGVTQEKTLYTITRITTVSFACSPGVENNV